MGAGSARLAAIWRHPVKGVGAEPLESVPLTEDRPIPGDRAFAILTGEARDAGGWQRCVNFARGCYAPGLMAVTAETGERATTFRHPDLPEITLDPATEGARLVEWIAPLYPPARPQPRELIAAPATGMADVEFPSISILGTGSLDALSVAAGVPLDQRRFRGNLWIEVLAPFEEFDWVGRRIALGDAELEVVDRIGRCRATEANPATGARDVDTLRLLRDSFGHTDFGIYARVTRGGTIRAGDTPALL